MVKLREMPRHDIGLLSERRLRWLGHVIRMDHQRIPRQALHWKVPGFKRGPGRPRTNWRSTVNDGNHLRESRGESSKQIGMASTCRSMRPLGYGLNQGQDQCHIQAQLLLRWPIVLFVCSGVFAVQRTRMIYRQTVVWNAIVSMLSMAIPEVYILGVGTEEFEGIG